MLGEQNANHIASDPDTPRSGLADTIRNHNPTTQDEESSLEYTLSAEYGFANGGTPFRRLRDRVKAALCLGDGSASDSGTTFDDNIEQIIRSLNVYPSGYPKVAAAEECDPNFLIFRKFSWLHIRVLLRHQDELVELEEDLERLDGYHFTSDQKKLKSRRRDEAIDSERKKLLLEIEKKLAAYDELLLRLQQVHAIKRPTVRNQTSLYNIIHNTGSLVESEAEWIRSGPDLAALAHDQESGWFNGLVEDTMIRISRTATRLIFRTKEQSVQAGDELIELLSRERFTAFINIIITVLATALLLFPVFILYELESSAVHQILVIFAFTLAFAACCSLFTKAKKQDVFAATAAYCAVLVVFLGNNQGNYLPQHVGSL